MDKEGTNTWRYAKAGAKVIVAISPEEVDIIRKTEMPLDNLDQITAILEQEKLDIVFIEGFHSLIAKRKMFQKLSLQKTNRDLSRPQRTVEPVISIAGIVAKKLDTSTYRNIPIIRVPEDGQKLVDLVKITSKATEN